MKLKWDNSSIALYSLIIGVLTVFPYTFLNSEPLALIMVFLINAPFIFLVWIYIRWVASTAEKAGRSYVGFMIVAILLTPIAWIIVLLFKKPETPPVSA